MELGRTLVRFFIKFWGLGCFFFFLSTPLSTDTANGKSFVFHPREFAPVSPSNAHTTHCSPPLLPLIDLYGSSCQRKLPGKSKSWRQVTNFRTQRFCEMVTASGNRETLLKIKGLGLNQSFSFPLIRWQPRPFDWLLRHRLLAGFRLLKCSEFNLKWLLLNFLLDYLADGHSKRSQPLLTRAASQPLELEYLLLHEGFAGAFAPAPSRREQHGSGGTKTLGIIYGR